MFPIINSQLVYLLINISNPTFLAYCGRGEGHRTNSCLKAVVGGKQGHVVKYFHSNKSSFVSVELHGDHETASTLR